METFLTTHSLNSSQDILRLNAPTILEYIPFFPTGYCDTKDISCKHRTGKKKVQVKAIQVSSKDIKANQLMDIQGSQITPAKSISY